MKKPLILSKARLELQQMTKDRSKRGLHLFEQLVSFGLFSGVDVMQENIVLESVGWW